MYQHDFEASREIYLFLSSEQQVSFVNNDFIEERTSANLDHQNNEGITANYLLNPPGHE